MRIFPCLGLLTDSGHDTDKQAALAQLYARLLEPDPDTETRQAAENFLQEAISQLDLPSNDLPNDPQDLHQWMSDGAQSVSARYGEYLQQRKVGHPRQYFINRSHALHFIKAAAPTKLVDGAWLYGLLKHWRDPKLSGLIRTYVEELGDGIADKNHVIVYKSLLTRYGLDLNDEVDAKFYKQGLIQLALAANASAYLPEVIGFDLGYEQLPLHLLITAFELNELNIDPYYFTLHITIDNSNTGHAYRAVQAVLGNLPRMGSVTEFWRRVKVGYGLSNFGVSTQGILDSFDIDKEIIRIFTQKSSAGHGVHSDYCRIGGRTANDWLSSKANIPEFLTALQKANWIVRGEPAHKSRFWHLLQGDRAEMFGVFSHYELQVIRDWICGKSSSDGQPYTETDRHPEALLAPTFRNAHKQAALRGVTPIKTSLPIVGDGLKQGQKHKQVQELPDADLQLLIEQLLHLSKAAQETALLAAMSPAQHWTPSGLYATRLFNAMAF